MLIQIQAVDSRSVGGDFHALDGVLQNVLKFRVTVGLHTRL